AQREVVLTRAALVGMAFEREREVRIELHPGRLALESGLALVLQDRLVEVEEHPVTDVGDETLLGARNDRRLRGRGSGGGASVLRRRAARGYHQDCCGHSGEPQACIRGLHSGALHFDLCGQGASALLYYCCMPNDPSKREFPFAGKPRLYKVGPKFIRTMTRRPQLADAGVAVPQQNTSYTLDRRQDHWSAYDFSVHAP